MLVKFRKYLVFIVLLLLLLLVVFLKATARLGPLQPSPSPASQAFFSPLPEAPAALNYIIEAKFPDPPKELPLYKIVNAPVVSLDEARALAAGFDFSGEPTVSQDIKEGSFYSWTTDDRYLSIGGGPPVVSFGLSSFSSISPGATVLATKPAAQAAENVLRDRGLAKPNIDLNNPLFSYFIIKGQSLEETPNVGAAQVVKVSYNYRLDSLPLLNNTPTANPISVFLGPKGELLRLIYTKYSEDFEKIRDVALLSPQKASENLQNQKGAVVYQLSDADTNTDIPPSYVLSSVKINKIFLAYYYPSPPENQAQPIFVFEGEALDQGGKIVKMVVFLLAYP